MSLTEKLLRTFETLPDDKKQEVIDFMEFLKVKHQIELESLMDSVIEDNRCCLEELGK